jgi:hypothetical protein
MVLAELGSRITNALRNAAQKTVIDQDAVKAMLKEICASRPIAMWESMCHGWDKESASFIALSADVCRCFGWPWYASDWKGPTLTSTLAGNALVAADVNFKLVVQLQKNLLAKACVDIVLLST